MVYMHVDIMVHEQCSGNITNARLNINDLGDEQIHVKLPLRVQ
jgi:hypothetical protein